MMSEMIKLPAPPPEGWPFYIKKAWDFADKAFKFVGWMLILGVIISLGQHTHHWIFFLAALILVLPIGLIMILVLQHLAWLVVQKRKDNVVSGVFIVILIMTGSVLGYF